VNRQIWVAGFQLCNSFNPLRTGQVVRSTAHAHCQIFYYSGLYGTVQASFTCHSTILGAWNLAVIAKKLFLPNITFSKGGMVRSR